MKIGIGFTPEERDQVAALYWEAFGDKLGRVLGPRDRALAFLHRGLQPEHAICARDSAGRIIGLAGFKTAEGAMVDGTARDMTAVYGWFGAAWRILVLAMLERDVENDRFLMDGIAVAQAVQGQGVGSRLIEAAATEAVRRGYSEIRLDVIDRNIRARALYERRGFVAIQEQSTGPLRHVFGFRTAAVMVRRLA